MNGLEQKAHRTAITELRAEFADLAEALNGRVADAERVCRELITDECMKRVRFAREEHERAEDEYRRICVLVYVERDERRAFEARSLWQRLRWIVIGR